MKARNTIYLLLTLLLPLMAAGQENTLGGGLGPGDPIQMPACVTTTYDYCGNLVYQDGTLRYLIVDGGFVTFTKTGTGSDATYTPTYHAYLRDNLGSNRAVALANGTAEEVYHYYPYGSMFNGGNMLGTATTPSQPYDLLWRKYDVPQKGSILLQEKLGICPYLL